MTTNVPLAPEPPPPRAAAIESRSSPAPAIDLDRYCARIGYTGSLAATSAVLAAIHERHTAAIAFENLDVLRGFPIELAPAALERKLIHERRGGYCFEQNSLFTAALRAIGFRVTPVLARVRWEVPPEITTGLTHLVLHVAASDGEFLADAGFGSMSLLRPLAFNFGAEQSAALEPRRLIRRDDTLVQQARIGDAWRDVIQFALTEAPAADIEMAYWFTSTHPQSRFRQHLVVALTRVDRRFTIFDSTFTVRHADGHAVKRELASSEELLAVLADTFDLHFPAGTHFDVPGLPWSRHPASASHHANSTSAQ